MTLEQALALIALEMAGLGVRIPEDCIPEVAARIEFLTAQVEETN